MHLRVLGKIKFVKKGNAFYYKKNQMNNYKIFALRLDGPGPESIGPFVIKVKNETEAYKAALFHIKSHLKIDGNYNIGVSLI